MGVLPLACMLSDYSHKVQTIKCLDLVRVNHNKQLFPCSMRFHLILVSVQCCLCTCSEGMLRIKCVEFWCIAKPLDCVSHAFTSYKGQGDKGITYMVKCVSYASEISTFEHEHAFTAGSNETLQKFWGVVEELAPPASTCRLQFFNNV